MRIERLRAVVWSVSAASAALASLVAVASAALASLVAVPGAQAQATVRWDDATGTPACVPVSLPTCVIDAECASTTDACVELEGGVRGCAPRGALFCADTPTTPCPVDRPHRTRVLDATFCLSDAFTPCDPAAAPTVECFSAGARRPVDWELGDCDRDGLRNGSDPAPCLTAPFIATIGAEGCAPSRILCKDDADCTSGVCRTVSDENPHEYCLPSEDAPFCCGGLLGVECPDAVVACEPDIPDGFQHCHDYCADGSYEDRLPCVHDGDEAVSADRGDCDGDGIRNGDELEGGTDPCAADDAGVPVTTDAGTPGEDAGTPAMDAGAGELDAGSDATGVTFNGGGGCRCGVASRGRAAMPWGVALLALVAISLGRRRRRA